MFSVKIISPSLHMQLGQFSDVLNKYLQNTHFNSFKCTPLFKTQSLLSLTPIFKSVLYRIRPGYVALTLNPLTYLIFSNAM